VAYEQQRLGERGKMEPTASSPQAEGRRTDFDVGEAAAGVNGGGGKLCSMARSKNGARTRLGLGQRRRRADANQGAIYGARRREEHATASS